MYVAKMFTFATLPQTTTHQNVPISCLPKLWYEPTSNDGPFFWTNSLMRGWLQVHSLGLHLDAIFKLKDSPKYSPNNGCTS